MARSRSGRVPMVRVPAGAYRPLYGRRDDPPTRVEVFLLDRDPVTRGDFLRFVRAEPAWRRDAVRPVFGAAAVGLGPDGRTRHGGYLQLRAGF